MPTAIEVANVSKRFRLYKEKYQTLKERAMHLGRVPYQDFWALSDIEFDIEEGETVGLLGHNGSGKSTLLKCIAGILQPTDGEIRITGRIAALLELGAGFHPDLTGRENVFLNASILGLPRREIVKRFDEIVDFAELGPFIDNQVKHYSSGMYVRLGFAVAVNMDPDILLVDEVLAVGDELFQRKCLDRVKQFQREGRTIVFVTHAADMVRQICDRAMVLDHGKLVAVGQPGEAIRSFREHLLLRQRYDEADQLAAAAAADGEQSTAAQTQLTQEEKRNLKVTVTSVEFEYPECATRSYLEPGDPLSIRVSYEVREPVEDAVFGCAVHDIEGRLVFGSNTDILGVDLGRLEGKGVVVFSFDSVPLADGTYPVTIGVHSHDEATVYDWWEQKESFQVMYPGRVQGSVFMLPKVEVRS